MTNSIQREEMTVDKAVAYANDYIKNEQFDDAKRLIDEILSQIPGYLGALQARDLLNAALKNTGREPNERDLQTIVQLRNEGKKQEALNLAMDQLNRFPSHILLTQMAAGLYTELGDIEKAEKVFTNALGIKRNNTELLNNYGIFLGQQSRFKEAIDVLSKVIKLNPNLSQAYQNLGLAYKSINKNALAMHYFHQALEYNPDLVQSVNSIAALLREVGDVDQATAFYKRSTEILPDRVDSLLALGAQYLASEQTEKAITTLEKVLKLDPDNVSAISRIGNALRLCFRYEEAVEYAKKAASLQPDSPHAYNNLGLVYHEMGRHTDGLASIDKALEIRPDFYESYNNRGITVLAMGDMDGAYESYNKALALNPDYAICYRNLATLGKKYPFTAEQIQNMKRLMKSDSISEHEKGHLHYALSRAYEDEKNHEAAFSHLVAGGKIRKAELGYHIDNDKNQFKLVKRYFNDGLIGELPAATVESDIEPLFILGMPRSGTSLTEQIISNHSAVHGAGELTEFTRYIHQFIRSNSPATLRESPQLSLSGLAGVKENYLSTLRRLNVSERIISDKSPLNFRWVGFILAIFPNAKIVNLVRDPRAVCWSIFKHYFSVNGHGYAYDLQDLAEYYRLYLDLMSFWREKFPGRFYDLNYELLTENQESETRKLLEYCELPWEDNVMNFHKNERAVRTASNTQVRNKMYTGSSEAWRKYEAYLEPLISGLGDALDGYQK